MYVGKFSPGITILIILLIFYHQPAMLVNIDVCQLMLVNVGVYQHLAMPLRIPCVLSFQKPSRCEVLL